MSDAWNIIIGALIGAVLAFFGGIAGERLKINMQNRSERKYITISLCDELLEIIDIISKFAETFEKSGMANKSYLNELANSMSTFSNYKDRLFLFKEQGTRREITLLYKKLKALISDSEGKVGTLAATTESIAEQKEIVQRFVTISTQATGLKDRFKTKRHWWKIK